MAYSKAWDETSPLGTAPANTLDTIIRDLKVALRERLEDVFENWTDDGVDPKTINPQAVQILRDTDISSRPGTPARDGNLHYADNQRTLSVARSGGWKTTAPISGAYNGSASAGLRLSGEADTGFILAIKLSFSIGASGTFSMLLSEFAGWGYTLTTGNIKAVQYTPANYGTDIRSWHVELPDSNTVRFHFFDETGTALGTTTGVQGYVMIHFQELG